MVTSHHPAPTADGPAAPPLHDRELIELVDALVEAVDISRAPAIGRLRFALEPFRASTLFDAELRLRGTSSTDDDCICREGF